MRVTAKDKKIRPARYNFSGISNVGDLIKKITTPSLERTNVTILEGWRINQITNCTRNDERE